MINTKNNNEFINCNNFEKYFQIYLISLLFFGIFYLYQKHAVGNDTSISEYLINYKGGLVRRGFVGEILFRISLFFDLPLRFTIFIFQSLIYTIFIFLIHSLFKNFKKNIVIIFSILTPIFLLFPIAELESLGRKETILYVYFLLFLNIKNPKNANLVTFFVLPFVCMIYEQVILFSGFFYAFLIVKNKITNFKSSLTIILLFIPAILINIIFIKFPVSPENHKIMTDLLLSEFNESCYMSCSLLIHNDIDNFNQMLSYIWNVDEKTMYKIFLRYSLIFMVGLFPVLFLSYNSTFATKNYFNNLKINNIFLLLVIIYIPVIPLFILGADWGRWIGMIASFTTIFYFYLYKNKLIIVNYNNVFQKISFFKNKKILTLIILVIFAFGWNQKTTSREDVATKPGYKIPYNTIKIIFNFDSYRIFENSFLNNWHKKYIE